MSFCFKYNSPIVSSNFKSNNYNLKKYIGKNVKSVDFVNQHSVKSNKLYFTNMFQRNNSPRINSIIMAFSDLTSNPDNLDYYFEGREISLITNNDYEKLKRLDSILRLYDNVPENEMIIKYAPNERYYNYYSDGYERGFQLFHTRDSEGNAKIYLIDLYHLAIPSKKNNLIKEYAMVMEYKKDIHDVIFSKINSLV